MAANDTVDSEAYIFTEEDVYMIGGYLGGCWLDDPDGDEMAPVIEEAIYKILSLSPEERYKLIN
jgi:hypothetical protein